MISTGSEPAAVSEPFMGLEVATVSSDTLRASVRVSGALEVDTAPLLTSVLRTHMTAGRRYLRVDLAEARIVEQSVVDALVESHTAVSGLGGMLVFENASSQVVEAVRSATLFVRGAES